MDGREQRIAVILLFCMSAGRDVGDRHKLHQTDAASLVVEQPDFVVVTCTVVHEDLTSDFRHWKTMLCSR
jgi:hypothetical protein